MTIYVYTNPQDSVTHIRDPRDRRRTLMVYPKNKHVPEGGVTEVTADSENTFADEVRFGQLVLKTVIVPVITVPADVKLDVKPPTSSSDLFPTAQTPLDSVRIEDSKIDDDSRAIVKGEAQRTIEVEPITVLAKKKYAPPPIADDEDDEDTTVVTSPKKIRRRRRI